MKIKFKKLHEGAVLPKKATKGSAAYDLYVPEDVIVKRGRNVISLGFAMEMEEGYEALVDARSGFSAKGMEGHTFCDFPFPGPCSEFISRETLRFDCDVIQGKIDADYRGCVGVIVNNRDNEEFLIKAGTRIAQLTFLKVETAEWEETDSLSDTDRQGGFGSTGTGA